MRHILATTGDSSSDPTQMNCVGPKKQNRHYSYDESLDEAPKLIEDETVDVEEAVPADENEAIERDDDNKKPGSPVFED